MTSSLACGDALRCHGRVLGRLSILGLLALGCQTDFYPAFRTGTADEFRSRVQKLCVLHATGEVATEGWRDHVGGLETAIAHKLRDAGFEVASPPDVATALNRFRGVHPGPYDTHTGDIRPEDREADRVEWARWLARELGCEARVESHVAIVAAAVSNGTAHWDGQTQGFIATGDGT
ncbi:MAG: hypothetical protein MJE66_01240, partial [Proteobacteria bacterium]|nr:hypothetical protein [Pseudomonadota bacterium]